MLKQKEMKKLCTMRKGYIRFKIEVVGGKIVNSTIAKTGAAIDAVSVIGFAVCMLIGFDFGSYLICMFLAFGFVMMIAGFHAESYFFHWTHD